MSGLPATDDLTAFRIRGEFVDGPLSQRAELISRSAFPA